MDGFVNRAAEMAALGKWWDDGHPVAAVGGRRRVGKTTLVNQFAQGKRTVFHAAAGRGEVAELRLLARQVRDHFPVGDDLSGADDYRSWVDAFDDLGRRAVDAPLLLVVDEVADLLGGTGDFPAALRSLAEDGLGVGNLRVLVISSRLRSLVSGQRRGESPDQLAGLAMDLNPFTPHEAAAMLADLDPLDRARVYGMVGGMPLYLSWWDQGRGLEENIEDLVCAPGAKLLTEGDLLMGADLDEVGSNSRLLHALAAGLTSYNDVREEAGTEPARPLDRLIDLRLIERVMPVGESTQARRRRYRITDPFVRFYLGAVSPRRADIDRGLNAGVARDLVAAADRTMTDPWGEAFRLHLQAMAAEGQLPIRPERVKVGPWWDNTGLAEIDALALAEPTGTPVLAGAATWEPDVDTADMVADLRRKVERGVGAYPANLAYAVGVRRPVPDLPYNVLAFTARDLFGV